MCTAVDQWGQTSMQALGCSAVSAVQALQHEVHSVEKPACHNSGERARVTAATFSTLQKVRTSSKHDTAITFMSLIVSHCVCVCVCSKDVMVQISTKLPKR